MSELIRRLASTERSDVPSSAVASARRPSIRQGHMFNSFGKLLTQSQYWIAVKSIPHHDFRR